MTLNFRKWPYTHCRIISKGEGMTSLHLKTNTGKTCVTFPLVSCLPGLTNMSRKLARSHLTCCSAAHESPAGNRVTLNPYMFQISHSAVRCFPSGIPPFLDQLLHLPVYSFLLSPDYFDLMSPSCSTCKCTMQ